jgi:DNA-directed RNA polymerase beta' subunit
MAIVQDSLLGAYRMTMLNSKITKEQFFQICLKLELNTKQILDKMQHIRQILKQKKKKIQCFNGKGLISMILPEDLIYEKKNNASKTEPVVKIYRGVMYEGALDKSILGASHNSLIQILNKEYGPDAAAEFIDGVQFVTNNWLLISGFSVGIEDCLPQDESKNIEISDVIQRCFIEAEGIKNTTSHPGIRELRITAALSGARDVGLRIARDALSPTNNFLSTVTSGSKGDFFNIAQITGLLGQQNLKGKRVQATLNHGRRTLPHYPFKDLSMEMEYESKGFIASSFIKGLNPREFYFHAMSGREGVSDKHVSLRTGCLYREGKQYYLLVQNLHSAARWLIMTGNPLSFDKVKCKLLNNLLALTTTQTQETCLIPRVMTSGIVKTLRIGQSASKEPKSVMIRIWFSLRD